MENLITTAPKNKNNVRSHWGPVPVSKKHIRRMRQYDRRQLRGIERTDADLAAFRQGESNVTDTLEAAVEIDAMSVCTHTGRMTFVIV